MLHCCGGVVQCNKPHKVSTTSKFGTPDGVLHCSMSPQGFHTPTLCKCVGGGPGHQCGSLVRAAISNLFMPYKRDSPYLQFAGRAYQSHPPTKEPPRRCFRHVISLAGTMTQRAGHGTSAQACRMPDPSSTATPQNKLQDPLNGVRQPRHFSGLLAD